MFSCEFCKISKSTIFTEHLWTTASASSSIGLFFRNVLTLHLCKKFQKHFEFEKEMKMLKFGANWNEINTKIWLHAGNLEQNIWNKQKQPPKVFYEKGVLRHFAKLTGKHLCQSLFFNKVASWGLQFYWKKRLWHECFPGIDMLSLLNGLQLY